MDVVKLVRDTHPLRDTFSQEKSIAIWLKKTCGSRITVKNYVNDIRRFFGYAGVTPDELLAEWKRVKYDYRLRAQFIDEWTEKIEGYIYGRDMEAYAPLTRMQKLTAIVSFFKHHRMPVEPEKEKHAYVKYHNKDITREEVKRILAHADLRDRTFFLVMLESGLRPNTLVQLRYKHIKKDFEDNKTPMMIDLPSELLKDRVEPRWTFIGEDAFKTLKEYLKTRMPLKNEDLVFLPERKDARRPFLSPEAFSFKFSQIALKLSIAEQIETGKPKQIRLYSLRKYFMNNIRCDTAFREFWMGHKTTQTHYVSRDVERHREEYSKAYENLRVFQSKTEQTIVELKEQLERRNHDIEELKQKLKLVDELEEKLKSIDKINAILDEWEIRERTDKIFDDRFLAYLKTKYPKVFRAYEKASELAGQFYESEAKKVEKELTKRGRLKAGKKGKAWLHDKT